MKNEWYNQINSLGKIFVAFVKGMQYNIINEFPKKTFTDMKKCARMVIIVR